MDDARFTTSGSLPGHGNNAAARFRIVEKKSSSKTSDKGSGNKTKAAATGDDTGIALWIALMTVSLTAFILSAIAAVKRKKLE